MSLKEWVVMAVGFLAVVFLLCVMGAVMAHAQAPPGTLTIKWTDNSGNELGFRCYRQAVGTLPRLQVCAVGPNITTCTSSEPTAPGYCYTCTAFNAVGESYDSNTACNNAPPAPASVALSIS